MIVIIERNPLLYEDAQETTEYISLTIIEATKEAAVLLYASGANPYFEELVKNAYRVFNFDEEQRVEARIVAKAIPRIQKSQTILEAFSRSYGIGERPSSYRLRRRSIQGF